MRELASFCAPYGTGNYREYTAEELADTESLERIFDECQIYYAQITADGWHFLIAHHGFEKLYEIDKKSGWFDEDTLEEYIADVSSEICMMEKIRLDKAADSDTIELTGAKAEIDDIKMYAQSKGMSAQALIRTALEEFRRARGDLHTPRYLLSYCAYEGIFFSSCYAAEEKFGYRIAPEKLPLPPEITAAIQTLYQDYIALRSPERPYAYPSLTPQQYAVFNARAASIYEQASAALGADYQIRKLESWFRWVTTE